MRKMDVTHESFSFCKPAHEPFSRLWKAADVENVHLHALRLTKVVVRNPLPYHGFSMRSSSHFLSEDKRWGMLEYGTLTGITAWADSCLLYELGSSRSV